MNITSRLVYVCTYARLVSILDILLDLCSRVPQQSLCSISKLTLTMNTNSGIVNILCFLRLKGFYPGLGLLQIIMLTLQMKNADFIP